MDSANTELSQDTFLVGIGASPGVAIGEVYLVERSRVRAVERRIPASEVASEIASFHEAVAQAKHQLKDVKEQVADHAVSEHLYILDAHLLILEDEMLLRETIKGIERDLLNAQGALKRALARFRDVFEHMEDDYLRARQWDVETVGERIMRNLTGTRQTSLQEIDRPVILLAHDLSPADTLQMDREKIIAFVTDVGGRTSHTAILARSLGIPAVVGLETVTTLIPPGSQVVVDGGNGTLIVNPEEETLQEYRGRQSLYRDLEAQLGAYRELPAQSLDGERIGLFCNLELPDEIDLVRRHGAEGIGLFRTEFLFMRRNTPPDEEEQFRIYRQAVEGMAPHPVTLRTLDVGGDKFVPEFNLSDEANPAMGLRAVRFSLRERRLFRQQLRAMLRASAFGNARILFPMITGVCEWRQCREILDEVRQELVAEGAPMADKVPAGVMIETPAAALIADLLAHEADFFSVGTNDLIQYCLAVDRGNEHVAYLYDPTHPAILRALLNIGAAARDAGIPACVCGEMASEPLYALVLLALGFNELSMHASGIPHVKRLLRQAYRHEADELLSQLLSFTTSREVASHLEESMAKRFPEIFSPKPI
ncbi:MAG: phosphoenolpyruvate--protein phosphotransferase [Desulfuromonas sp.]|nr:MAG: phosphoenolpyruvate--protein phosphotransferase [Desulfuromonas sp.]